MNQLKTKKQPYTGDPNATLTICLKKHRRHLRSDLAYVFTADEATDDGPQAKGEGESQPFPLERMAIICRHCKQDPRIHTDEAQEAPEAT